MNDDSKEVFFLSSWNLHHTLTCLAYDALLPPTGITVTCAGDNHSGLDEGKTEAMSTASVKRAKTKCILLNEIVVISHHFPPKFSASIAIILSSDPSTALWIITGLCSCPSRLREREGKGWSSQWRLSSYENVNKHVCMLDEWLFVSLCWPLYLFPNKMCCVMTHIVVAITYICILIDLF